MERLHLGAWLGMGGLALAALPLPAPHAQTPTTEEALADRFKQIQGRPGAGDASSAQQGGPRAQELIEQIEAIRREAQSEAGAAERPSLGEDEIATLMREDLGVDVLRVEASEYDGRPVYAVTVMSPPGNRNSAFLVETLLVDAATGGLLGRLAQTPRTATAGSAAALQPGTPESTGLEIRRRTYR